MKARTIGGIVPAAALLALAAAPADAQRTTFQPSLSFGAGYTDNVEFVGMDETSDTAYVLALDLPVTRQLKRGTLSFRYAPSYEDHADLDELDHDEHRIELGIDSTFRPGSALNFSTSFSRSQTQGNFRNIQDPNLTLARRTDRDSLQVQLEYSRTQKRWNWITSVAAGSRNHEDIPGFTDVTTGFDIEDRDSYHGSFGFGRQMSKATSLGLTYRYDQFELETSGEENNNELGLTIGHQLGRRRDLDAFLGAFRASGDLLGTDRSGFSGRIAFTQQLRSARLSVYAGHAPSSGGSLSGTSTDTNLGISLAGTRTRRWDWFTSASFARRDSSVPGAVTLDTLGLGAEISRRVTAKLALSLTGSYLQQSGGDPALDREVNRVGLGLIWYPRGIAPRTGGQRG